MFAKSMASYLESSGYGTIDKDIFINLFPSRTDINDAICVYDTQSFSVRGRARNSVNFNCQIRIRNSKTEIASDIAQNIYRNLDDNGYIFDSNGKRFTIKPMNPPNFLMFDDSNRANWILNVTGLALNY